MSYTTQAQELKEIMIRDRRFLHQHPEIGMDLPETCDYVMQRLSEMGYEPRRLGGGVTADLYGDRPGKTFLLRADMDALPMKELSGLPFASQRNCAHTCGHDMHTAMLLGAAKLLKDHQHELCGRIRFMFQPGEEVLGGAKSMIEAGILDGVDAAMGTHMIPSVPVGFGGYGKGTVSASSDHLKIVIHGKGGHGAHPNTAIDPINIGVHIHLSLQELLSREIEPGKPAVLTFGIFQAGDAANIIPGTAVMEGTLRTFDESQRKYLLARIREVCAHTAQAFRGSAEADVLYSTCALTIDTATADQTAAGWIKEGLRIMLQDQKMSGSEDFAEVAARVPSTFFVVGGGTAADGCGVPLHNPTIRFNEDALPIGAAAYASGAAAWLEANADK